MLKKFNQYLIYISISFFLSLNLYSDDTYFIDFSRVLNQSKAGSEAQNKLKKKFEDESKKFKNQEEDIRKQEQDLISQKKILSNEEYQKKITDLRKKVSDIQIEKSKSLNSIAKSRAAAKEELLVKLNPIIKKYMEQNSIRLVIDKQSVILGDTKLEITDKIIAILNEELKSIKVN